MMTTDLTAAITTYLDNAGYAASDIEAGIAYADAQGYSDEDEALSLTVSRVLYSDEQLEDGERFGVEGGWREAA